MPFPESPSNFIQSRIRGGVRTPSQLFSCDVFQNWFDFNVSTHHAKQFRRQIPQFIIVLGEKSSLFRYHRADQHWNVPANINRELIRNFSVDDNDDMMMIMMMFYTRIRWAQVSFYSHPNNELLVICQAAVLQKIISGKLILTARWWRSKQKNKRKIYIFSKFAQYFCLETNLVQGLKEKWR